MKKRRHISQVDFKFREIRLQSTLNMPKDMCCLSENNTQRERQNSCPLSNKQNSQTLGANKGVAIVTKRFRLQEKPASFRVKPEYINYRKTVQMVPDLRWFDFDFSVVQKRYIFSRSCTSNFEFRSFPGLAKFRTL